MFDYLATLFTKLPKGSIYLMTCNRELKLKESRQEYNTEEFKNEFGSMVPFDIDNFAFTAENNYKTIRNMFMNHISNILKERSKVEDNLKFFSIV